MIRAAIARSPKRAYRPGLLIAAGLPSLALWVLIFAAIRLVG
ncbi:hypothetical protein J2X45_003911 [Caulobacter sp. BE264]|nr:hypothetical protein [Caulobacter sp. BE264]MDR7232801.1 hypothetical protein [Caulobacter sp. BE264]